MNTRAKIMGLAALPLAGLLATGGVAIAQGPASPAGTQIVQQAAIHKTGYPCPEHVMKAAAGQATKPCPQHAVKTAQPVRQQARNGDCANCGDHQAKAVQTAAHVMEHARDGSCDHHADR